VHQQAVTHKEVSAMQTLKQSGVCMYCTVQSHDGCPRSDKVLFDRFIKVQSIYLGLGQLPTNNNA